MSFKYIPLKVYFLHPFKNTLNLNSDMNYISWIALFILISFFSFFFFVFFLFRAIPTAYGGSWARGPLGVVAAPTLQPQQCQIWADSATYTTAHTTPDSQPTERDQGRTGILMDPNGFLFYLFFFLLSHDGNSWTHFLTSLRLFPQR